MKFLVSVEPNPLIQAPPDQLPQLLRGMAQTLRNQLQSRKLDCCYSTGQGRGFAITEAASVEQIWDLLAENPMTLFWNTTITPLGDPIALTDIQLRILAAPQPVGAGSRN